MNPYKVLGVREDATDEEIKAAYRQLVKKYHPDQYGDNPLADLAQEKLKEINEAYAAIETQRKNNKNNSYYYQSGTNQSGSAAYAAIRALINAGQLQEAEARLAAMAARDAEWYFLRGVIYRRKGWHTEAADCFARAAAMDPGNEEYCRAQADTARRAGVYSDASRARGGSGCDLCLGLCVADSCCECMGGDLIPCC